MNMLILFCAVVLIFIAAIFAAHRVFTRHEKKYHVRHIIMLSLIPFASWHAATFLKNAITFPRPDLTNALFLPQDVTSYGLPSGHTAFMFALAATMYSFDKKAGIVLFVLAVLTGIGRALAGVHYWYDIVGGAVLGFIIASFLITVCKRLIRHW